MYVNNPYIRRIWLIDFGMNPPSGRETSSWMGITYLESISYLLFSLEEDLHKIEGWARFLRKLMFQSGAKVFGRIRLA